MKEKKDNNKNNDNHNLIIENEKELDEEINMEEKYNFEIFVQ
jgi:hypothetical protein